MSATRSERARKALAEAGTALRRARKPLPDALAALHEAVELIAAAGVDIEAVAGLHERVADAERALDYVGGILDRINEDA